MELSKLRLLLLRACYLLLGVGLALTTWPSILSGAADLPLMNGFVNAVLGAICLLAFVGLFKPIAMLPLLVFEVLFKAIWVVSVALPLWIIDGINEDVAEIIFACAFAIPFAFIIPWWAILREFGIAPQTDLE